MTNDLHRLASLERMTEANGCTAHEAQAAAAIAARLRTRLAGQKPHKNCLTLDDVILILRAYDSCMTVWRNVYQLWASLVQSSFTAMLWGRRSREFFRPLR